MYSLYIIMWLQLRLHKDIGFFNLPKTCNIAFPNGKDDLMNFEVTIRPDEGYYLGGNFVFTFNVSSIYPHEAPKVKCKTKVYHPNIDLEGNVCLNILHNIHNIVRRLKSRRWLWFYLLFNLWRSHAYIVWNSVQSSFKPIYNIYKSRPSQLVNI